MDEKKLERMVKRGKKRLDAASRAKWGKEERAQPEKEYRYHKPKT